MNSTSQSRAAVTSGGGSSAGIGRARFRRLTRLVAAATALLLGALVIIIKPGCVATLRPPDPAAIADPVTVYVADYHRHSSLLLPGPVGGTGASAAGGQTGVLIEFAFGEWEWFARQREHWTRAPGVMLTPSQGTLGREMWPYFDCPELLRRAMGVEAVHALTVERARAEALRDRLEARFRANIDTLYDNRARRMAFVHDDDDYSIAWHCNHATVAWLRELGVSASHAPLNAAFRVRSPSPPARRHRLGTNAPRVRRVR